VSELRLPRGQARNSSGLMHLVGHARTGGSVEWEAVDDCGFVRL
jgi:hypothetical protein